ncbi:hypothetical protein K474DRAFT_1665145 [Panus rudis PR-1116 ss-1]|nr:hypothetical protein K474DRAFT_1665145 [Panus rudis PR-1116 ss-1]
MRFINNDRYSHKLLTEVCSQKKTGRTSVTPYDVAAWGNSMKRGCGGVQCYHKQHLSVDRIALDNLPQHLGLHPIPHLPWLSTLQADENLGKWARMHSTVLPTKWNGISDGSNLHAIRCNFVRNSPSVYMLQSTIGIVNRMRGNLTYIRSMIV